MDDFYTRMEEGFCQRGEEVLKQLQIMLEVKQLLKENRHRRPRRHAPPAASPGSTGALLSGINSPSSVPGRMSFLSLSLSLSKYLSCRHVDAIQNYNIFNCVSVHLEVVILQTFELLVYI